MDLVCLMFDACVRTLGGELGLAVCKVNGTNLYKFLRSMDTKTVSLVPAWWQSSDSKADSLRLTLSAHRSAIRHPEFYILSPGTCFRGVV